MNTSFGKGFGGLISLILLLLYMGTMAVLVTNVVTCGTNRNCTMPVNITQGATFVFTTVSGLVSALVVAVLAITIPGENPGKQLAKKAPDAWSRPVEIISAFYLGCWIMAGLAALVVGVMFFPDASATLRDAGTSWLGLAIAAGYAYFGIQPIQNGSESQETPPEAGKITPSPTNT